LGTRIKDWLKGEREKLRGMTLGKKLGYIFGYYKGWIAGLLLLCLLGFYIGDVVVRAGQEVVLEGFFTNDDYNLFDAGEMRREYAQVLGLGPDQQIIFDDSLYVDMEGGATEYTAASNGKLIAYMATQELDFVVTSEDVLLRYAPQVPMLDMRELLPADLLERLSGQLYYYTNQDGERVCIALDMTESRYVAGTGADRDPRVEKTYYLFAPYSAPHVEQLQAYLRYCFPPSDTLS